MKKIGCLLLALWMALACLSAAAEGAVTPLDYDALPQSHRTLYENQVAEAIANAPFRLPGASQLFALARGDFNGYTGSKTKDGITVEYTVSNSMVQVGESIKFNVKVTSGEKPFIFTVSGLVLDNQFDNAERFSEVSGEVADYTWEKVISYKPTETGYVNFTLAITDEKGNEVSLTTSTIQVYEDEEPLFRNIAIDGNGVAVVLSLDDKQTGVGEVITATATFTTKTDPVSYEAVWTLYSEAGEVLDEQRTSGQCSAQEKVTTIHFDYWPLQAGKTQFVVTATDGEGNKASINTPYVPVADGFSFRAELDKAAFSVGESITATYSIHGHECDDTKCIVGWNCYDPQDTDKVLYTVSNVVDKRSGAASFTPRFGEMIEFYARASCEHYPDVYPAYARATLLYGVYAELSLSASTVKSGSSISLNYSVVDGIEPYQEIQITGYSVNTAESKTYTFFRQTVTAAEGKVTGTPYLGDQVYFEVKVTEQDGYVSTWRSATIPLTGAPEADALALEASVDVVSMELGETVTLTYKLTGGSGALNANDPDASTVVWQTAEGETASSARLTKASGTAAFTPEEKGEYICVVTLTDSYNQRVTWTSDSIYVGSVRIPGDADDNGLVNLADAQLVIRYGTDSTVEINADNADVNADSAVDLNDALLLLQFNAGWNVKLK